jgi:hypothetical protein
LLIEGEQSRSINVEVFFSKATFSGNFHLDNSTKLLLLYDDYYFIINIAAFLKLFNSLRLDISDDFAFKNSPFKP